MISIDSGEKFIGARIKLTGYGEISIAVIGYGCHKRSSHNHPAVELSRPYVLYYMYSLISN